MFSVYIKSFKAEKIFSALVEHVAGIHIILL